MVALVLAFALTATPRTFRVDYFHTGNAVEERFSFDRAVVEPLPWPGNPARPLDDTNAGKYFFEVREATSRKLLYSRGFSSIYGEWEQTDEAKRRHRTFHESLRFPQPAGPVLISLKKRDARNLFREVWNVTVDPTDVFVDTSMPPEPGKLLELHKSGEPGEKLDLLLLGDGYTEAERDKFEKDARRLMEALFTYSPFKERKRDINVWGLCPPSPVSGVSRPSTGVHRRTPVGATYDAFRSERYILTFDNRAFRDHASFAPYELVQILVNGNVYGGGGIFNLFGTVASDSRFAPYVFVHELGHHMAGLADEYFTGAPTYEPLADRLEPWEPNVTALKKPDALKWKALVSAGTPVPTPWSKPEWERWQKDVQARRRQIRAERRPEGEMDALFLEEKAEATRRLSAEPWAGKVGAFEGASYESRGLYRPQADCVMFTRNEVPFCAVCQHALSRVLDLYATRPGGSRVGGK